jgi:hypothetical protein
MLIVLRYVTFVIEALLAAPKRIVRFLLDAVMLNPYLGWTRYLILGGLGYVVFALALVYIIAPARAITGQYWLGEKLRYDSERWLATAIYDREGAFVGTFDPLLDSVRDFNTTGKPILLGDTGYVANPDHKSIPVHEVPEAYWQCLVYHEDRNLGSWLNPFGIDLAGVLKIPVSTVVRSLQARGIRVGVGGSTLPMQLARVIYQTPPDSRESTLEKLRRKFSEWWDAPVIYWALTRHGDKEPLRQWTANHLWLAQRTGGSPLHGVEMTSRVVFGKPAKDLSIAEQFVLASAVNKPIILLEGSEQLNAVRLDRWRYIVDVRARKCASELITDAEQQKKVWFDLTQIANGPPDPQVRPKLQRALDQFAAGSSKAAQANPVLRANVLIPDGRYGLREEMKNAFGYDWREYVRGVTTTLDIARNMFLRERIKTRLGELQQRFQAQINPGYTLDPAGYAPGGDVDMPNVIVAAANAKGELVRYFELKDIASYFGSPIARDSDTGHYDPKREVRAIASIGKMIAATALANQGNDTPESPYFDTEAPGPGLSLNCMKGSATRTIPARFAFACSLNNPIERRMAQLGQDPTRKVIDGFGLNMPRSRSTEDATPPTTAAVRGLVTGSPQKVQQMAAVILAALTGRGRERVRLPTLVKQFDRSMLAPELPPNDQQTSDIVPFKVIKPDGVPLIKALLSAPLCNTVGSTRVGTLSSLGDWCAGRKPTVTVHFAKTGTQVTIDPDATVDAWAAGGIQFANADAYSYVVVVGTGDSSKPFARKLHAAQIAAPLLEVLLQDLSGEVKAPAAVAEMPLAAAKGKVAAVP